MNTMKYYVDADGNYLGGWDANPPDGAIEVPFAPQDARQKWEAEQAAYVPPPVTLPDLAPYQFRAMLALSGKQADLDAFIEALPEPNRTIARAKLEFSLTFKRDNDLVVGARAGLGLTDAELDALWLQAASIL